MALLYSAYCILGYCFVRHFQTREPFALFSTTTMENASLQELEDYFGGRKVVKSRLTAYSSKVLSAFCNQRGYAVAAPGVRKARKIDYIATILANHGVSW